MSLFSEGAEQALIAKLLLDPAQIPLVSGAVAPEDFYISDYREAFRVMLRLTEERKAVDIVSLQTAGLDVDVMDLTPGHHAPLAEYAATIKDFAFRRKVVGATDRVARAAQDGDKDLMATLQDAFTDVVRGADDSSMLSPTDAVEDYLGTLAARIAGESVGMTYGIPGMDKILLPAGPGELIIMAARPSVGKSAMAENVADHWSHQGQGPILFVSLEMKMSAILDRTMSRHTQISARKIISGDLTAEELGEVQAAAEGLRTRGVIFLDNAYATTGDVRSAAAKAKMLNNGELGGIVVDYLQILKDAGDQEVQRVTKISRNLKAIAVENDCPLVALSQFSRRVEMENREPQLSDLRESGALEQDADVVVAMQRPLDQRRMRVYVLKQRQGAIGNFVVDFDGDTSSFSEPQYLGLAELPTQEKVATEEHALSWG